MILTEADAKTRWCPFARLTARPRGMFMMFDSALVDNRVPENLADDLPGLHTKCLGSGCMAWRWAEREALETVFDQSGRPEGEGWEPYSDSPRNCAWKRPNTKPGKGYCGLAGQP